MLIRIARYFFRAYRMKTDPVGYARGIGVKVGNDCRFYSVRPETFGSDPYLITIGNNVHVTDGVRFITHDGGTLIFRNSFPKLDISAPISVGSDVYIGTAAIILPGVTIGDSCVIAAGAVVTKDVLSGSVVGGVPARMIKSVDDYLLSLQKRSLGCGDLGAKDKENYLRKLFRAEGGG